MDKYIVTLKIYGLNESFKFEFKEYNAPHILDLMKQISTDYINKRWDVMQITSINYLA